MATQDELKKMVAQRALDYVKSGAYLGVGTGSTVQYFIEALANSNISIKGAVSTSKQTSDALAKFNIPEVHLNETGDLSVYIDGADEVNHFLQMIKGGGGALVNEKIIASASKTFVCIADESKYVNRLGVFPVPVEVLPSARSLVARQLVKLGGEPNLRIGFTSDNGHEIMDVEHLNLNQPMALEEVINGITGVVDNGICAKRPADILLLARSSGVEVITAHVG